MTNTLRFSIFLVALAASTALRAQGSITLPWNQACQYMNSGDSHQIQITTVSGETVQGVCFAVTVDEIRLKTKTGILTIARSQLSRVRMYEIQPRRQLAHLAKTVGSGLKESVKIIPTDWGIIGVVGIPATLAWGGLAAPFCLFGDIIGYTKTMEIKIK
jgi:hypothetical protein